MSAEYTHKPPRPLAAAGVRMPVRVKTDSFERMFEEHAQGLFSFLVYRTGNRALAEDLLSETFERVLRSRHRFDPRMGSERRWIYTIAMNLLRDNARRHSHEDRLMQTVSAGARTEHVDAFEAVEQRDELNHALATLSEAERDAISLRYGADLKLRDVAKVLGEDESAVEGRIYRGLAKLRERLA